MKYLKTYEGLFDVFKSKEKLSDEKIVKDYINQYEDTLLDLNVSYDSKLKCIIINELLIYTDNTIMNNGKELKCSESLIDKLYDILSDIVQYNNYVVDTISRYLKLPESETRERLLEFEVIRNGNIDQISLESLVEYYKSEKQTPFQIRNPIEISKIPNVIKDINREIHQQFIMNTARKNMH